MPSALRGGLTSPAEIVPEDAGRDFRGDLTLLLKIILLFITILLQGFEVFIFILFA